MNKLLCRRGQPGFTLFELLVVLAIIGIISLIGYPALLKFIYKARIEGAVRQTATLMRAARLEAVKRGVPTGVMADFTERRAFLFLDHDESGDFNEGDEERHFVLLPANISFTGPPDAPDDAPLPAAGFNGDGDGAWVLFSPDGSADRTGALRIGDARGNYLEVQVEPRASGRVDIRKWDPDRNDWFTQGEGRKAWTWN